MKRTIIISFILFSLLLLSWCWKKERACTDDEHIYMFYQSIELKNQVCINTELETDDWHWTCFNRIYCETIK